MCMMCPDFVDACYECGWTDGKGRQHPKMFWLIGEDFCEHLKAEHGTENPSHYRHFRYEHHNEDCECVAGNWWGDKPRPTIPKEEE